MGDMRHEWRRSPPTPQGHCARWVLSDWPRGGWIFRLAPGVFLGVAIDHSGALHCKHIEKLNAGRAVYFSKLKLAKWALERWVDGKPMAVWKTAERRTNTTPSA